MENIKEKLNKYNVYKHLNACQIIIFIWWSMFNKNKIYKFLELLDKGVKVEYAFKYLK